MNKYVLFGFVMALLVSSSLVMAAIPHETTIQGRLTDANGNPLSGSYQLTFTLYETEISTEDLWAESYDYNLQNGVFSINLGSKNPLNLDFSDPYWLEIEVYKPGAGPGETLTPRVKLTSSGYSLNTETIDTLDSEQFLRSDVDDTSEGDISFPNGTGIVLRNGLYDFEIENADGKLFINQPLNGAIFTLNKDGGAWFGSGSVISGNLWVDDIDANGLIRTSGNIRADGIIFEGNQTLSSKYQEEVTPNSCVAGEFVRGIADAGTLSCAAEQAGIEADEDYGRSGVSDNLYEGIVTLGNKYLKLDASNDPVTGQLDLSAPLYILESNNNRALVIEDTGSSNSVDIEFKSGTNVWQVGTAWPDSVGGANSLYFFNGAERMNLDSVRLYVSGNIDASGNIAGVNIDASGEIKEQGSRVCTAANGQCGADFDTTYLRLDATNDPITGQLDLSAPIHISNTDNNQAFLIENTVVGSTKTVDIEFKKGTNSWQVGTGWTDAHGGEDTLYLFSGSERMGIDGDGSVYIADKLGIGPKDLDPDRKLDVYGTSLTSGERLIAEFSYSGTSGATGSRGVYLGYHADGSNADYAIARAGGSVPLAIGTTGKPTAIYITNAGDITLDGNVYVDNGGVGSGLSTKSFYVTRFGASNEGFRIWADDRDAYIRYKEDESTPGTIHLITENSAASTSHDWRFEGDGEFRTPGSIFENGNRVCTDANGECDTDVSGYLKLDASNDPVTNSLEVSGGLTLTDGTKRTLSVGAPNSGTDGGEIIIRGAGSSPDWYIKRNSGSMSISTTYTSGNPVLNIYNLAGGKTVPLHVDGDIVSTTGNVKSTSGNIHAVSGSVNGTQFTKVTQWVRLDDGETGIHGCLDVSGGTFTCQFVAGTGGSSNPGSPDYSSNTGYNIDGCANVFNGNNDYTFCVKK